MKPMISLDAHAHSKPSRTFEELASAGAILAMTLSLGEAATGGKRLRQETMRAADRRRTPAQEAR